MSLKSLGIASILSLALSACSTISVDGDIMRRDYSAAMYSVSFYEAGASDLEVDKVAEKIKSAAGASYQQIFFEDSRNIIRNKEKNGPFFKDMRAYIGNALRSGLVSPAQAQVLNDDVYHELALLALRRSTLVSQDLMLMYPHLPRYMAQVNNVEYTRALKGELLSLDAYASAYEAAKQEDAAKSAALLPVIRAKVAEVAKAIGPDSGRDLSSVISIYTTTRDPQVEQAMLQFISRAALTKAQLKDEVAVILPELARKMIAQREILVKIVSESDDPFIDELPGALEAVDQWITVDEDAKREIKIVRLRINEKTGNPIIQAKTVSAVDILTLLFIPRGASVLYDMITTNYNISWSMNVSDSAKKGSKVISGKKSEQKVECSNIRYKNVFGGEGPVDLTPSNIESQCADQRGVDFEDVREQVVKEIATEIVQMVHRGSAAPSPRSASK